MIKYSFLVNQNKIEASVKKDKAVPLIKFLCRTDRIFPKNPFEKIV